MAKALSERVAALESALAAAERQASAQRQRAETAERNEAMLRLRVKAAEDSERTARVEGAREALTRCLMALRTALPGLPSSHRFVEHFRDREYPATGEEPTRRAKPCAVCCSVDGVHDAHCDNATIRPAPPAAPEPPRVRESLVEVLAHSIINGDAWVRRLAKRLGVSVEPSLADEKCENAIVDALFALASRPTASGEG